jgi:hypothetical protein
MPCIIVRRGDLQQYDRLYRAFGDRVPVVWDRRRTPQPTGGDAVEDATRRPPARASAKLGRAGIRRRGPSRCVASRRRIFQRRGLWDFPVCVQRGPVCLDKQ